MNKIKTLSSRKVFSHPWESIEIEKVQLPNKKIAEYLISKPNPFVIAVLENNRGEILLLNQYKHGAKTNILGFVAGYMRANEKPLNAAVRELKEETGMQAKNWKLLGQFYENPTRCPTPFYVFKAKVTDDTFDFTKNPDAYEKIGEGYWVSRVKLAKQNKKMQSAPMVTALWAYLNIN